MSFAGLTFLAPLVLIGLLTLPLVWWILRISPPKPREQIFPPLRILEGVQAEEETPAGTPLWLLIFRLLMVALVAIALAQPIFKSTHVSYASMFDTPNIETGSDVYILSSGLSTSRRVARKCRYVQPAFDRTFLCKTGPPALCRCL